MKIAVKKVNAFTDSSNGGNPAGVLLKTPNLTDKQMAYISKKLKVSETAFVFPSTKADYKIRFFTPTIEVDLCGHATIATFYTMAIKGYFPDKTTKIVTQETKAGILPVELFFDDAGNVDRVMMKQSKPVFRNIKFNTFDIAKALRVNVDDIDDTLPKQVVSTGLFTLPVCIKSFDILKKIKPDFTKIKKTLH